MNDVNDMILFTKMNHSYLFTDSFSDSIISPVVGDQWDIFFNYLFNRSYYTIICDQCWGKLLLKVMHYNIALLPKKVTNYVT